MVDDDEDTSKDKEIDKLMALISLSFKKIYKPTNNNLRTSSNTSRANQDNSPRIHKNAGYEGQRSGTVAGARDTVGSSMPKRAKDAAYHREKMLLCKQEEAGIQLNAEQADWRDDTDDESDDQELEAHYMYMAKLQQVSPDVDDSGPIFDKEPEQKKGNRLRSFMKVLPNFKNKNKSLTEANNKLSEVNAHLYADYKKSKDELKRRNTVEYATKMELECAKLRVSELQNKLSAHQDTISVLKQQKDAQIKLYKTREDKDIEKVIDLENKVK
nr:hypothetical protein [Tanacetum cinerariifolium]